VAERLEIILTATDRASAAIRANRGAVSDLRAAWVGYAAVAGTAVAAGRLIIRGIEETIGATLEYADEVRRLSQVSGEGAEATSRFVQVLDDFKITAANAETAMRTMRTTGLTPTTESLARASDQFLGLNPGIERTNFLLTTFGRQGASFAEIMLQGSEAIREHSAAIEDGLVLTEQDLLRTRELEIATDRLDDAKKALAFTLGMRFVPGATRAMDALLEFIETARVGRNVFLDLGRAIIENMDLPMMGEAAHRAGLMAAFAVRDSLDVVAQSLAPLGSALTETGVTVTRMTQGFEIGVNADRVVVDTLTGRVQYLNGAILAIPTSRRTTWTLGVGVQANDDYALRLLQSGLPWWSMAGGNFTIGVGGRMIIGAQEGPGAGYGGNLPGQADPGDANWNAWLNYWASPSSSRGAPPATMAQGGEVTVPPGFPNDTFPVWTSSGEEVSVRTPEQKRRGGSGDISIGAVNIYSGLDLAGFENLLAKSLGGA
jgi:hypothetical protein